ncbi:MAG: hypothetical protein INH41_02640 [Myxococcaceae bacterium]|jgi:hypothetical protein|nr:hypothetical protein [Myxococcaceae bacterium]
MRSLASSVALCLVGCAHVPLSPEALATLERPAFVARVENGAGPRSSAYRDDASRYAAGLANRDPREADRQLALVLDKGTDTDRALNRYQLADTLRAQVLAELPKRRPWDRVASPAQVASLLESFLVDEQPAREPDLARLAPLGVDSVVELVVEEFGLESRGGKAGVYLVGFARLVRLGGQALYRRAFFSRELSVDLEPLDPVELESKPSRFGNRLRSMLLAIARQLAVDLSPAPTPAGQER